MERDHDRSSVSSEQGRAYHSVINEPQGRVNEDTNSIKTEINPANHKTKKSKNHKPSEHQKRKDRELKQRLLKEQQERKLEQRRVQENRLREQEGLDSQQGNELPIEQVNELAIEQENELFIEQENIPVIRPQAGRMQGDLVQVANDSVMENSSYGADYQVDEELFNAEVGSMHVPNVLDRRQSINRVELPLSAATQMPIPPKKERTITMFGITLSEKSISIKKEHQAFAYRYFPSSDNCLLGRDLQQNVYERAQDAISDVRIYLKKYKNSQHRQLQNQLEKQLPIVQKCIDIIRQRQDGYTSRRDEEDKIKTILKTTNLGIQGAQVIQLTLNKLYKTKKEDQKESEKRNYVVDRNGIYKSKQLTNIFNIVDDYIWRTSLTRQLDKWKNNPEHIPKIDWHFFQDPNKPEGFGVNKQLYGNILMRRFHIQLYDRTQKAHFPLIHVSGVGKHNRQRQDKWRQFFVNYFSKHPCKRWEEGQVTVTYDTTGAIYKPQTMK